jgi:hypothetical protein
LSAAKLGFGSCQTRAWHLPNSGLAAAKPNSGLAAAKLGFGSCQIKNAGMAAARVVFGCNENTNNKNNMKT